MSFIKKYFTSKDSSIISIDDIKKNSVLTVYSFEELKVQVESFDYKIGILLDRNILQDSDNIDNLNKWLKKKINFPIVVIGYGNPTYTYFKKLLITDEKYIPRLDEERYELYKKENGFSLAYICNDGKIYGKGYKEECNLDNILRVLNNYLRGEDNVRKIVEYGE
ncbi:hypothetical protein [Ruminiclostridium cellobioparum]|uniref:hypothetical protein n=1 Tax=Ruminiclostridium cellobioparum TaxID=29355 RepID=UPI000489A598|nr:hypothetical protein [Ruminiclostridium cellobioparum]